MIGSENRMKSAKQALWIALIFAVILLWSAFGKNT
jgi:hypothetical protein